MPTLIKKRGSDVWFVRYRHHGQDRIQSTGETEYRKAVKHLKAAEAEARLELTVDNRMDEVIAQLRRMPEQRREEVRLRLIGRLQELAERKLLLSDAWAAWLAVPKQTGEATLTGYEAVWTRLAGWLREHRPSIEHLSQLGEAEARDYAEDLWASEVSAATFNMHVRFLARMWKQLRLKAGLGEDIWGTIERQSKRPVSHDALTAEQLAKVIGAAEGELRWLLLVGLLTALRLKDAVYLNVSSFDAGANLLRVTPFKTRRLGKMVTIPVHSQLLPLLTKPGPDGFYFPKLRRRYVVEPASVSKTIQQHFQSCGLKTTERPEGVQRKRAAVKVGFHSLRFSFVSLCAAKNTPQHVLGEIVGHSSPSMTLHYSKADNQQRRDAVGQLPVIDVDAKRSKS